jgi:hypothetical protein
MSLRNTEPDAQALAQALLRLPPDAIDREVRPLAPEIADILLNQQQAHAKAMAERTVKETIREANRERTRILIKDQLRMLLLFEDPDIAHLAAAELLSREPTSQLTVTYVNGNYADVGYDATGAVYIRVYQAGPWDHWLPATGKA